LPNIVLPPGEVVVSMRPVCVFANGPGSAMERLRSGLRGRGGRGCGRWWCCCRTELLECRL